MAKYARPGYERKLVNQKADEWNQPQEYGGIEQPMRSLLEGAPSGINAAGLPASATNPDPLGLGLQHRGTEHANAYKQAEFRKDPRTIGGPVANPIWEGFQQALYERGVQSIRGGPTTGIDPSSRQLQGTSAQPDYFTTGATFTNPRTGRTAVNADYVPRLFDENQTIGGVTGPGAGASYEDEQRHLQRLPPSLRSLTGRR